MKNKKGFTLIELLAVIVILGLILFIAIPSVSKYINQSKRKTLISSINGYITAVSNDVKKKKYYFTNDNVIYAIPIECASVEKGGDNPFGEWMQASNEYWAYVLVQYDKENYNYNYGFTFKDSSGLGINPTVQANLNHDNIDKIQYGLDLYKPTSGAYNNIAEINKWDGFNVNDKTQVVVLKSNPEKKPGDGRSTCTLQQKGDNYEQAEEQKDISNYNDYLMYQDVKIGGADPFLRTTIKRKEIEKVYTVASHIVPSNALDSWDVSASENGSIMAWTTDKDNDGLYEMYIGATGGVIANPDSSELFGGLSNVTRIDVSNFNVSNTYSLKSLFNSDFDLEEIIGLDKLDTSNVTSMELMFRSCFKLKSIDVSNFDTSNVTNIYGMFYNCDSLEKIDVSNFNTSNVTNMGYLFAGVREQDNILHYLHIEEIKGLTSFDTSNVTNMMGMFSGCIKLETLDLTGWDTSNVTNMSYMFNASYEYTSLKEVKGLENFNTENVTTMKTMFQNARYLKGDLNKWDFSKVTEISYFLYDANSLNTTLNINFKDPSKVKYEEVFSVSAQGLGSNLTINYTSENEDIVDAMIATRNNSVNIIKGNII